MKKYLRKLIGMGIALVLIVAGCFIGIGTEVFEDFADIGANLHINGGALLKSVIIIALLYIISTAIQILFDNIKTANGRALTILSVVSSLVKYAIVIIGFCWVLSVIGVNISTIFASLGIIALIIGFGAERLIADVVTGLFMLFENQFNVGDIIEINGFRGSVETIGIRTISLKDAGGNVKIINNSDLENVVNRSNSGSVAICEVGVAYSVDLRELEKKMPAMLADIKNRNSDIFVGEVEYLGVEELADSSVVLKIKADVDEKNIFSGRRLLNKEIKCAFDDAGIEIAFPQLDVHNK